RPFGTRRDRALRADTALRIYGVKRFGVAPRFAECNSAIQQIENLRYEKVRAPRLGRHVRRRLHFKEAVFLAGALKIFKTPQMKFTRPPEAAGWLVAQLCVLLFGLTANGASQSASWPQFRGPGSLGISENPNLPDRWSTNENI